MRGARAATAALFACATLAACGSGGGTPDVGSGNPPPAGALNWGPERTLATNASRLSGPTAVFGTGASVTASVAWAQAGFAAQPANVPLVGVIESAAGTTFDPAPQVIEQALGAFDPIDSIDNLASSQSAAGNNVVWRRTLGAGAGGTRLSEARRAANGGWSADLIGAALIPAASAAQDLVTASNTAGDRIAAWTELIGVTRVVRISWDSSADGASWQPAITYSAAPSATPAVAIDANGLAMIVWRQNTPGQIVTRTFNARTGTPGVQLDVDNFQAPPNDGRNPHVTAIGLDDFVATWEQTSGGVQFDLRGNRGNSATWTNVSAVIDTSAGNVDQSQVVSGQNGIAFTTWRQNNAVFMSRFTAANGVWFQPRQAGANLAGSSGTPVLAADSAGNALFVWVVADATVDLAYAVFTAANTTLTSGFALETAAGAVSEPSVSMAANGAAVVAWRQAVTGQANPNVVARVFRP